MLLLLLLELICLDVPSETILISESLLTIYLQRDLLNRYCFFFPIPSLLILLRISKSDPNNMRDATKIQLILTSLRSLVFILAVQDIFTKVTPSTAY